jgi:hypothetical protein
VYRLRPRECFEVVAGVGEPITGTPTLPPGLYVLEFARAKGSAPLPLSQTVKTASARTFETDFELSHRPVGLESEMTADGP